MPSLGIVRDGRPDLPGPLSQLGLGRDGTFYVIAAGRCNHAGAGEWQSIKTGNSSFIGIEAENTGLTNDFPWPQVQLDAYQRGVGAILKKINKSADFCCGHREYAEPKGRKPDPTFDMDAFRFAVTAILSGAVLPPLLIPAVEPSRANGQPGRPTLRRGSAGELVQRLQAKLGVEPRTGNFGAPTESKVRAFQRENGMVGDGIVGPETWKALDELDAR
jgi:N-acetyl-anhydromuramyl-L-alanine amidase AmpD